MSKIKSYVISNQIFKIFLIVLFAIKSNPYLNSTIVARGLTAFTGVWGIVILVEDIFSERKYFKQTYTWYFLAFGIAYIISIFVNYNVELIPNLKDLLWYSVSALVLTCPTDSKDTSKAIKEFKIISYVYIICTAIFAFGSIFFLIFNKGAHADFGIWGFYAERLYGLYRSPNYGAIFSVISISLSLYLFTKCKNKTVSSLLIFNIIFEFLYIVYSNSNSGKVCLITCVTMFLLLKCITVKHLKYKVLIFVSIFVISASIIFLMQGIKIGTEKGLDYINSNKNVGETIDSNNSVKIELDRHDTVEKGYQVGNGRVFNWKVGIKKVLPNYWKFGTTKRGYSKIVRQYDNTPRTQYQTITLENDFVSLLVCTGVLGFVIMMCTIFKILYDIFKNIILQIKNKNNEKLIEIWPALSVVFIVGISMLFTDAVIFANSLQAVMFWISLGVVICKTVNDKKEGTLIDNINDK